MRNNDSWSAEVPPPQPEDNPLARFSAEEQQLIQSYTLLMFGEISQHTNELCDNPEAILRHARAAEAVSALQPAGVKTMPVASRSPYKQLSYERALRIEKARSAWRQAVSQRSEQMRLWDAHIKDLHDAFRDARNEPLPTKP